MRIPPSRWIIGGLLCAVLWTPFTGSATAAEEDVVTPKVQASLRKLGRGVANIVMCLGEIPRTTAKKWEQDGYLAASTVGLTEGVWRSGLRLLAGVFEVATFFSEIPPGYAPLIEPEFVFGRDDPIGW